MVEIEQWIGILTPEPPAFRATMTRHNVPNGTQTRVAFNTVVVAGLILIWAVTLTPQVIMTQCLLQELAHLTHYFICISKCELEVDRFCY